MGLKMAEQPYVTLMLRVLAQARAQHYRDANYLQLTLWLAYRVLDINPRNVSAYLVLAYFFCLLGEGERACRLLRHYTHAYEAQQPEIQAFLKALQSRSPDSVLIPEPVGAVSGLSGLPGLQDTLQRFSQIPATVFQDNVKRALPALSRLAHQIKDQES